MNSGANSTPFDHVIVCACSVKYHVKYSLDQWIDFLVFSGVPSIMRSAA